MRAHVTRPCGRLQPCTFKVDYTLPTAPGLDFGSVFVANGTENLALSVAAAGWAKVRSMRSPLRYAAEITLNSLKCPLVAESWVIK